MAARTLHPISPLAILALAALGFSLTPGLADPEYDYVAKYVIDDASSAVTFSETGTQNQVLSCPNGWTTTTVKTQTDDPQHKIEVRVSISRKEVTVADQQFLEVKTTVALCPTAQPVQAGDAPCGYANVWDAEPVPSSPRTLPNGWSQDLDTAAQRALGTIDGVSISADMNVVHAKPRMSLGSVGSGVPFTGRVYYEHPTSDGDKDGVFSNDVLAGVCQPSGEGAPDGCCKYAPTTHDVKFEAKRTTHTAPPVGDWRQFQDVCNSGC